MFSIFKHVWKTIRDYNPKAHHLLYLIFVIVMVYYLLGLILILFFQNKNYLCLFDSDPYFAKYHTQIAADKFEHNTNGHDFTIMFWIKIVDWDYKLDEVKHIFSKGENVFSVSNLTDVSPAAFMQSSTNNLLLYFTTARGLDKVVLDDIPIGNWNHIGIVCRNATVELYKNGKLYSTSLIRDNVILNFGDMHFCNFGGFGGYLKKFKYSPKSLKSDIIMKHFYRGV